MICNKAENTSFDQMSCLTLLQHMVLFSVIMTWSEAKSTEGITWVFTMVWRLRAESVKSYEKKTPTTHTTSNKVGSLLFSLQEKTNFK